MKHITEQTIMEEYIAKKHFTRLDYYLQRVVKTSQLSFPWMFSFRQTGPYSVLMLEAGAAAKPHSILDKTLKDKTLIQGEEKSCLALTLLYGLVVHRNERDYIDGLYLARKSATGDTVFRRGLNENLTDFVKRATGIMDCPEIPNPECAEDMKRAREELFRRMRQEKSCFWPGSYAANYITGDYDLHDLISKIGTRGPVPSDSIQEAEALCFLDYVMTRDYVPGSKPPKPASAEFVPGIYDPVQHGPQYNYVAHMYSEEKTQKLVAQVAAASFPVLILNVEGAGQDKKIEWTVLENLEDLNSFYNDHGINIKSCWLNAESMAEYVVSRQDLSFQEYMAEQYRRSKAGIR